MSEHKKNSDQETREKGIKDVNRMQSKATAESAHASLQKGFFKQEDKEFQAQNVDRWLQDHNAKAYVASVFNPWEGGGVRKPDLTFAPTTTWTTQTFHDMALVAGTASDAGMALAVTPSLIFQTFRMNAFVNCSTPIPFSPWQNANNSAFAVSNFQAVRCVSLGVKVVDYGTLVTRGVKFVAGLVAKSNVFSILSFDAMASLPQFQLIDISDDGEMQMVWQPVDGVVQRAVGDNDRYLASSWFEPGTDVVYLSDTERVIVIAASVTGPLGLTIPTDKFAIQITGNYEALPLCIPAQNFDCQMVVGGGESIAAAASGFNGMMGNQVTQLVETGVHSGNTLKKVAGWVGSGLKTGAKVGGKVAKIADAVLGSGNIISQVASGAGAFMSSIGGLFSAKHYAVFQTLQGFGLNVSIHNPLVAKLAGMENLDVLREIDKLLRDPKARKEVEYSHILCNFRATPLRRLGVTDDWVR